MSDKKTLGIIYDFAEILMTAVLAVTVVFAFFFKTSVVNGDSMKDTLHNGDTVIISSINKTVDYGDVVVISQPNVIKKVLIKRVIATEGQTVTFDSEHKKVLVDGVELNEPYLPEKMNFSPSMTGSVTVPEGMLFVMGDNRNDSTDSRDPIIGFIDERYVVGKVLYVVGDTHLFEKDT
ncbi:MAG: signal peptidase I [Oscillospiraceae bacterium]|nr:signal peptidase I [Oscillospiraceae bacterium]